LCILLFAHGPAQSSAREETNPVAVGDTTGRRTGIVCIGGLRRAMRVAGRFSD
jgi:hypothetical protein